eukprot:4971369-Pyramimonas_sp.AAC.1
MTTGSCCSSSGLCKLRQGLCPGAPAPTAPPTPPGLTALTKGYVDRSLSQASWGFRVDQKKLGPNPGIYEGGRPSSIEVRPNSPMGVYPRVSLLSEPLHVSPKSLGLG